MRPDYLRRFQDMVDELRRHPQVAVSRVHVAPPVTDEIVRKVQSGLGFELAEGILELYRQANGLSLEWVPKEHSSYDPDSHDEEAHEPFDMVPQEVPGGVIHIYPLESLLDDFEDVFWFDWMAGQTTELAGAKYDLLAFSKALRPIDYFSEYSMAALFLGDRVPDPPVLLGDDHGASFTSYRPITFETYLEGILALRGSALGRQRFFARAADAPPTTVEGWLALVPSLDELVRWSVQHEREAHFDDGSDLEDFVGGDLDDDFGSPNDVDGDDDDEDDVDDE